MNAVQPTHDKGDGLFALVNYEQGDTVQTSPFVVIPDHIVYNLDEYTQRRMFYDGVRFMLPSGDIQYVNHDPKGNCKVVFTENVIALIAKHTIRKRDEITIDYGEENTDFLSRNTDNNAPTAQ